MAIEQHARAQVACKVVELRKIGRGRSRYGPPERPVPAEDVDILVQQQKIKAWGEQKRENHLEEKLKLYFREIEILASISHVSRQKHCLLQANLEVQPNIIGVEKVYVTQNTMYGTLFSISSLQS